MWWRIQDKIEELNPAPSFVARFYELEKMNKELIKLLEEVGDLRLIMSFDFNLYKTNYIELESVYHKAIKEYLETHAGNIATRFIDEILNHLSQLRAHKLVSSIKQFISVTFPHRHHLSSFS